MAIILLVEDNREIIKMNASALKMRGYDVLLANNLSEANSVLSQNEPDMIVLDILLPDGNGIEWCKKIKTQRSIPILFLSALNNSKDVVDGLRSGGDDYLTKPYNLNELIARIEVRLRTATHSERFVSFGDLILDCFAGTAAYNGRELFLTQKEYAILRLLVRYAKQDRAIPKKELYETIWTQPLENDSNALWTALSRLKAKLADCNSGIVITFTKAEGYLLEKE